MARIHLTCNSSEDQYTETTDEDLRTDSKELLLMMPIAEDFFRHKISRA